MKFILTKIKMLLKLKTDKIQFYINIEIFLKNNSRKIPKKFTRSGMLVHEKVVKEVYLKVDTLSGKKLLKNTFVH